MTFYVTLLCCAAMVAKAEKYLGHGMYTVREAAMYARVPTGVLSRWLFGGANGKAVFSPEVGDGEDRRVTFLDFIQTLAIREIRIQRLVPLHKFRQAIDTAKKMFDMDYPFARQHCTYLHEGDLLIRPNPEEDGYWQASGRQIGQGYLPFVESYLENLDFALTGLANRYRIFTSTHPNPVAVTMDPEMRFGEPLLPSGYTAMGMWDAIRAEGGIDRAAKVYGVPREEVETAYRFVVEGLGQSPTA